MWPQLAAAAAPYVIAAFQKQPKRPSYQQQQSLPDRSAYFQEALRMARDPNNQAYRRASEAQAEQVNRMLANQGLGGSSVGGQLMVNAQTDMSDKFYQQELDRYNAVMGQMMEYDRARAGVDSQNYANYYQAQMGDYQAKQQQNAAMIQGVAGLAGAYANYQGRQEAQTYRDKYLAELQAYNQNINQMNPYAQPQGAPVMVGPPAPPQMVGPPAPVYQAPVYAAPVANPAFGSPMPYRGGK